MLIAGMTLHRDSAPHPLPTLPQTTHHPNARRKERRKKRTLSFNPRKRAHPLWTNASFAATTATTSTPFALSSSIFCRNGGRWFTWQVGYMRINPVHMSD